MRKRIWENMARSKHTAAHFHYVDECDVSELVKLRDRVKGFGEQSGVKLTFLPFIIKAVVAALKKHPRLNSVVDEGAMEHVLRKQYEVRKCRNAEEAERSLADDDYHLLITDLRMPGMGGLHLLETLASKHPKLARVLLSGYAETDTVEGALDRGTVDAWLLKPVDSQTLLEVSARAQRRRAARSDVSGN